MSGYWGIIWRGLFGEVKHFGMQMDVNFVVLLPAEQTAIGKPCYKVKFRALKKDPISSSRTRPRLKVWAWMVHVISVIKYFHAATVLTNKEETVRFEWSSFVKSMFVLQNIPSAFVFHKRVPFLRVMTKKIHSRLRALIAMWIFFPLVTLGITGFPFLLLQWVAEKW